MAKAIKLYDGYKVNVDDDIEEFKEHNWDEVMDYINIPKEKEIRSELFRHIFAFGVLDLSKAYHGHKVIVSLIPVKD